MAIPKLDPTTFGNITHQGTTSPTGDQQFYYGDDVGTITGTAVSGASYQWQKVALSVDSSSDGNLVWGTYNNILGATAQSYSPGALYVSTSFRRRNTVSPLTPSYTLLINFLLWSGGNIEVDVTGTNNLKNVLSPSVGFGFTGVTYQRQSSPDNSIWSDVGGETGLDYDIGSVDDTYYRRKAMKAGEDDMYSNVIYNSVDGKFEVTFDIKDSAGATISGCDLTFDGTVYPAGTTTVRCYDSDLNPLSADFTYTVAKDGWSYDGTIEVHGDVTATPFTSTGESIDSTVNPSSSGQEVTLTVTTVGTVIAYLRSDDTTGIDNITVSPTVTTTYWCRTTHLSGQTVEISYIEQVIS